MDKVDLWFQTAQDLTRAKLAKNKTSLVLERIRHLENSLFILEKHMSASEIKEVKDRLGREGLPI